jgi:glycosyltransferase involved in cell wall biosynthesis
MIDVIIPVKDRPEVETCVQSLSHLPQINRVFICDGGSEITCRYILAKLQQLPKVHVLQLPISGFNKSYLMNQGILQASAEFILMSDADIVWNGSTLKQLQHSIDSTEDAICSVHHVEETDPVTVALKRDRYTYTITRSADAVTLDIRLATEQSQRPGCGLLLSRQRTLLKLGGYKESFQGWGWEDQDLLIRAQLLGIKIATAGQVLHLSHQDDQRNIFHQRVSPSLTRNRNLLVAINSLLQRNFWGDLSRSFNKLIVYQKKFASWTWAAQEAVPSSQAGQHLLGERLVEPKMIQVYLPDELRKWLYELDCESIAANDLSWARNAFKNTDSMVAATIP